jgi:hypothetical protein
MPHRRIRIWWLAPLLLMACDLLEEPLPITLEAATEQNHTVTIAWDEVAGATAYRLDRRAGDDAYLTLAELDAAQRSFEDFPVPDEITVDYRLTASGPLGDRVGTRSVAVPAVAANPLSVGVVTGSGASSAVLGPAGGTVAAELPGVAAFELLVPPGALASEVSIVLTPVTEVVGAPLSGGLLGAVVIEPEDLPLDDLLLLRVTPLGSLSVGTRPVGFSATAAGEGFALRPLGVPSEALATLEDDDLAPLLPIRRGGLHGTGAANAADARGHARDHPSGDGAARADQLDVALEDDLAPLPGRRQLHAGAWATRWSGREAAAPSSATVELLREFRQWHEYLRRHGLTAALQSRIAQLTQRMAARVQRRFAELVAACEAGERSVAREMRELLRWSSKPPVLAQRLGSGWFADGEAAARRCALPNWRGVASASQPEAFESGYYGSAQIDWILDESAGGLAKYVPAATGVSFHIPSGECQVFTVTDVALRASSTFLFVYFDHVPAIYSGAVVVDVTFTTAEPCNDPPPAPWPRTMMFPLMVPTTRAPLSADGTEIAGEYDESDTSYTSSWSFRAVAAE